MNASIQWALAYLTHEGFSISRHPFGVLIKKPHTAYLVQSDAEIIATALAHSSH
jgi:hypothetical protein